MTTKPDEELSASSARKLLRVLRLTSIAEGLSYLLLLGVAMPLKYVFHHEFAVKIAGSIHGALFVVLCLMILLALMWAKLPFKTAILVGIASLLPAGPFFADRLLKRHQRDLTDQGGSLT
jgi:integral membrane protein